MAHPEMAPDAVQVRVGPQGRVVIPAELRRDLALGEGDTLSASVEEGRLVLEPRSVVLKRLRDRFAHVPGKVSLSDELSRDRAAEAGEEAGG